MAYRLSGCNGSGARKACSVPLPGSESGYSRLCLAIRVARRCKATDVVAVLEELTSLDPAPAFIRSDNGPEFIV